MTVINLRKYYYPIYTRDTFMEVPDEVAEAIIEGQRIERREDGKKTYHGVYSLDASIGIENHAMFLVPSPEDILLETQEQAEYEELLARLAEAISRLTPTQARRLHARYALKKKLREIAADEGISGSCVSASLDGAIRKLQKIFAKNGWLEKEV